MSSTTENSSLTQFTNTSGAHLSDRVQHNEAVFVRNILLGTTGPLFNIIAITFLSFKKNFKLSLRVTLIGLSLNDLCFTVNGIIYCNPDLRWATDVPYCWPAMYVMASSLLVSFLTTTLLAVHNYVAIVYPLHCDDILPSGRSLAAVICCWVTGYLTVLGCLGTSLPPRSPCFAIVAMPRSGLVVQCTACLICAGIVVVFNLIVCVTIRNRRKINLGVHSCCASTHPLGQVRLLNLNSDERGVAVSRRMDNKQGGVGRFRGMLKNNRISPAHWTSEVELPWFYNKRHFRSLETTDKTESKNVIKKLNEDILHKERIKDIAEKKESNLSKNNFKRENWSAQSKSKFNKRNAYKSKQQSSNSLSVSDNTNNRSAMSVSYITSYNTASSSSEPTSSTRDGIAPHASNSNVKSSQGERSASDRSRRDKKPLSRSSVSVSLIVLTCWSSLLILPLMIFMIYVAILILDRKKFPQSDFGKLTASILAAHSIGNPILYGWRFISWSSIYRCIIHKFHRR